MNKDLTTTSKAFLRIKGKLAAAAMDIVLICNQSIIESVQKNKNLSMLYFLNHGIDSEWIRNRARIALDSLGTRYNGAFNVDTKAKEYLELFLRKGNAKSYLNEKKAQAVDSLNSRYWVGDSYASLAKTISNAIIELPDINEQTLDTCLNWVGQIKDSYSEQLEDVQKTISTYEQRLANGKRIENNEDEWAQVQSCKRILDGIDHLAINRLEQSLINKKILLVTGAAGAGKSQLFANTVAEYSKAGRNAILILGNAYLTSETIFIQTQKVLNLNIELQDFLGILNELGKRDSTIIPVFFDGINESDDVRIWKNGLGELIRIVESLPYVKMAISIRDGYEGIAFDDAVKRKISSGEVIEICHRGFEVNSIEAIKTFMNHYNIPFLPDYALQAEMQNPLFLMLFCETYAEDNAELFRLFDRYIEKKDAELLRELSAEGTGAVLQYLLLKQPLNHRDYLWTIYINDMASEDRVLQLIEYFEQGNSFLGMNTQSLKLMLTLFAWLLTSSNRRLRDQASKAIVEILCRNFDLCLPLLEKFENVDDPYVLQRLYCCVFGACIKRTDTAEKEYEQLALYVYNATLNFRWETEQDASQVDTVSLVVPCMSLVRTLGLLQKEYNGCFYDSAGNLIAFDARPLGLGSSLWFRKNEMLRYIRETGYVLFWTCFGEKQFFTGGWGRQITGDWSGFYYLDKDGNITGNSQFFE